MANRVRNRTQTTYVNPRQETWQYTSGKWKYLWTESWDGSHVSRVESFTDELGDPLARGVKNCFHSITTRELNTDVHAAVQGYTNMCYHMNAARFLGERRLSILNPIGSAPPPGFGGQLGEKVLEKIASADPGQQAVMGIPFLGELRQTVSMIRNPLGFLMELAKHPSLQKRRARKMPLRDIMKKPFAKALSDGYLQQHYGWAPLLSDLVALGDTLVSFREKYEGYLKNQSNGSQFRAYTSSENLKTQSTPKPPTGGEWELDSDEHKARCILWARFRPEPATMSKAAFLRRKLGLTADQILPAAWELTPWSFVVDWFIPVGKTISKWTSTPCRFEIGKSQYDYKRESKRKTFYSCLYFSGPYGLTHRLVSTTSTLEYTRRRDPFLSGDRSTWFSTSRAVTASALIAQKLLLHFKN